MLERERELLAAFEFASCNFPAKFKVHFDEKHDRYFSFNAWNGTKRRKLKKNNIGEVSD